MSNPQIITPDQLDALSADFDLSTGPLAEEVLEAIRTDYQDGLELLLGSPLGDVTVCADDDDWGVYVGDTEVRREPTRLAAFDCAGGLADPDPPITTNRDDWFEIGLVYSGGAAAPIVRSGTSEYSIYPSDDQDPDGEPTRHQTLGDALALAARTFIQDW